jgi:hypothetical protein
MLNLHLLVCQNHECEWHIPIPLPTRPDTSRHQAWWPMDGLPRNFQCPKCKRIFEYKSSEVHRVSAGYNDQSLVQKCNNIVCVEVSCGKTGCATPLQIHILIAHGQDMYEEALAALQQATLYDALCRSGHAMNGPLQAGSIVSVQLDDDWERGNP